MEVKDSAPSSETRRSLVVVFQECDPETLALLWKGNMSASLRVEFLGILLVKGMYEMFCDVLDEALMNSVCALVKSRDSDQKSIIRDHQRIERLPRDDEIDKLLTNHSSLERFMAWLIPRQHALLYVLAAQFATIAVYPWLQGEMLVIDKQSEAYQKLNTFLLCPKQLDGKLNANLRESFARDWPQYQKMLNANKVTPCDELIGVAIRADSADLLRWILQNGLNVYRDTDEDLSEATLEQLTKFKLSPETVRGRCTLDQVALWVMMASMLIRLGCMIFQVFG